ncbi:hypothetical protein E5S70_33810 [Ensifer adhaerens]|uniref:hypothetical protein n=1 Tax=Ensifer canadensis TaxID=555315 RepID=UPI001490728A|nr:hypothetical protein [Ensifer canadensis]NOV20937.1 hypothetical protein [Ensifer canadensis]
MTAKIARLRPVPTIQFEPEEGLRLRRASGEAGLEKAMGADTGRPRWSAEIRDVQMMANIAVNLLEELSSNVRTVADIYETTMLNDIGIEELAFQIHAISRAAKALQPS